MQSVSEPATSGMFEAHGQVVAVGTVFKALTIATVVSIFGLVTLGGVVRLTGSGLGCPDWPLCDGSIIPSLDRATLIEYSHRMVASFVGILVIATAIVVWRNYRNQPWLFIPTNLAVVALIAQVLLGGVTVLEDLSPKLVMAHLALAEVLVATMVLVAITALTSPLTPSIGGRGPDRFPLLALTAMGLSFILLISGSYVATSGATIGCGQSWPLCQGEFFVDGHHPLVHMIHRFISVLAGIAILATLITAWRRRKVRPLLGLVAVVVAGLFLGQVMVGASILWAGFPLNARLLHLSMATLVWIGLSSMVVLAHIQYRPVIRGIGHA